MNDESFKDSLKAGGCHKLQQIALSFDDFRKDKTSHTLKSGDLKMVKVRRGKRGHRQSRSLVFRISRSSKPISDDSGIKCSSTEEETSSGGEQTKSPPCSLKVRIPKSVLHDASEKNETSAIESVSSEHLISQSNNKLSPNQHKDVFNSEMDVSGASMDDLNLNEDNLGTYTGISCVNSGILNADSKQTTSRINETKSCDLRRSSRRILLRVQKDCHTDPSIKETSNDGHKFPFVTSNSSGTQVPLGEKRKRGRKPGVRASECKKRKYGRRGRPPKSPFPKNLSLVKPVVSGGQNEKLVLVAPPKNSVWTLVPKELFESEFFKSQLLKVRLPNPAEEGIKKNFVLSAPVSFPSPVISHIPASQTNGLKQFKVPVINFNNVPVVREKTPEEKDPKRPTVIYFKTEKKKFDYSQDQKREFRNPQLVLHNEVSKTQNDLLYLFNKYRMLEDIILKNYYEVAGGNLNEAESMLSNFLSSSPAVSPEEKVPSTCEPRVNISHYSVFDIDSSDQASRPTVDRLIPSSKPTLEDVDTLSRKIIVQSLRILYSEEAVMT